MMPILIITRGLPRGCRAGKMVESNTKVKTGRTVLLTPLPGPDRKRSPAVNDSAMLRREIFGDATPQPQRGPDGRFVKVGGHGEIRYGVCACGCGRRTQSRWPRGKPAKYYPGHSLTRPIAKCAVKTCDRQSERTIYCNAHYIRVQKYGDPQEDRPITVRRGSYTTKDGYVVVPANGHPNAHKNGSIFEHVVVMSAAIGRPLFPDETVHHKNGVRHDNDPANLELWSGRHPTGARVADQIRWANEVFARYGDDPSRWENASA